MGWKAVKDHYHIEHIVQVTDAGICIGSPYVHNLIVIDNEGGVHPSSIVANGGTAAACIRDLRSDPEKLRGLIQQEDTFSKSITVYTYDGAKIIEKQCEKPGWPNCTHDGEMMHENTFSTDKSKVIEWAKRNAEAGIQNCQEAVDGLQWRLKVMEDRIVEHTSDLRQLRADYPDTKSNRKDQS